MSIRAAIRAALVDGPKSVDELLPIIYEKMYPIGHRIKFAWPFPDEEDRRREAQERLTAMAFCETIPEDMLHGLDDELLAVTGKEK